MSKEVGEAEGAAVVAPPDGCEEAPLTSFTECVKTRVGVARIERSNSDHSDGSSARGQVERNSSMSSTNPISLLANIGNVGSYPDNEFGDTPGGTTSTDTTTRVSLSSVADSFTDEPSLRRESKNSLKGVNEEAPENTKKLFQRRPSPLDHKAFLDRVGTVPIRRLSSVESADLKSSSGRLSTGSGREETSSPTGLSLASPSSVERRNLPFAWSPVGDPHAARPKSARAALEERRRLSFETGRQRKSETLSRTAMQNVHAHQRMSADSAFAGGLPGRPGRVSSSPGLAMLQISDKHERPTGSVTPSDLTTRIGVRRKSLEGNCESVNILHYYTIGETIGRGSNAVVKEATDKVTGEPVAIKILNISSMAPQKKKRVFAEIDILRLCSGHPNIIKLKKAFTSTRKIYLVMEKVSGGELFDRICNKGPYKQKDAALLTRKLALTLAFLHQNKIIHRDLKPENLLFTDNSVDSELRLADFGLAKQLDDNDPAKSPCGTPGYCAPEVVNGSYDHLVDLFSLGVIVYVVLCGFPPFFDENSDAMFRQIRNEQYDFPSPYWDDIDENAKNLIRGLLEPDPAKRLDVAGVLESPWIVKYCGEPPENLDLKKKDSDVSSKRFDSILSSMGGGGRRDSESFFYDKDRVLPSSSNLTKRVVAGSGSPLVSARNTQAKKAPANPYGASTKSAVNQAIRKTIEAEEKSSSIHSGSEPGSPPRLQLPPPWVESGDSEGRAPISPAIFGSEAPEGIPAIEPDSKPVAVKETSKREEKQKIVSCEDNVKKENTGAPKPKDQDGEDAWTTSEEEDQSPRTPRAPQSLLIRQSSIGSGSSEDLLLSPTEGLSIRERRRVLRNAKRKALK